MTSTLIENLVERVSQKQNVSPHILFDEIALNLNERCHNYNVVDSLDEIDWAFCSEHFMYESCRERVTVEEKPDNDLCNPETLEKIKKAYAISVLHNRILAIAAGSFITKFNKINKISL